MIGALKMVKESGATHMGLWAGIDGFTCPLGTVYYEMLPSSQTQGFDCHA